MELKLAKNIAIDICKKMQPFCDKINIAGGIRRQKSEPHDIEIICLPKKVVVGQDNLFNEQTNHYAIHFGFSDTIHSLGKIIKGKIDGKMMQIELHENIMLDLFMPDDFDYYRQYAIRTGSADYTAKYIAAGWKNIGWCGSDKGLRKISDCIGTKQSDGKTKWKCINVNAELPPVWKSEEYFFEWLGIKWIHPTQRVI